MVQIAASGQLTVAFDKVSTIGPQMADDLCALGSGTGLATWQLCNEAQKQPVSGRRPLLWTAMDVRWVRAHFLARTLWIELPEMLSRIPELERRGRHDRLAPARLGSLLVVMRIALAVGGVAEFELDSPAYLYEFVACAGRQAWHPGSAGGWRKWRRRSRTTANGCSSSAASTPRFSNCWSRLWKPDSRALPSSCWTDWTRRHPVSRPLAAICRARPRSRDAT